MPRMPLNINLKGQTALITGATSGLGLESAVIYTNSGVSRLIITARTLSKGVAAQTYIEERTGIKNVVEIRILDMDTFDGVLKFVKALRNDGIVPDTILLNAGVHAFDYSCTPTGWETDVQVNVLSTALLAILLYDILQANRQSRAFDNKPTPHLCVVGSGKSLSVDIQAQNWLQDNVVKSCSEKANWPGGILQYAHSKLLMQYEINELAKLAVGEDGRPYPIINTVCPGAVKTNLAREFCEKSFFHRMITAAFLAMKGSTVDVGARSLVVAAASPEAEHGKFHRSYQKETSNQISDNYSSSKGQETQVKVWNEINQILNNVEPEVGRIVGL